MRNDWIRLPMSILQLPELQPTDAIIASILFDIAEHDTTTMMITARCTRQYIANNACVSLRTVSDSIKRLSKAGIIINVIRTGKSSFYLLKDDIIKPKKKQKIKTQEKNDNYGPAPMIIEDLEVDLEEYKKLTNQFD